MLNIRDSRLTRAIATGLVALQLNMLAITAWADSVQDSAGSGQKIGQESMQGFSQDQALLTLKDVFPDMGPDSTSTNLQDVFGRDKATIDIGTEAQGKLVTEGTMQGEAYRTLRQSARRVSPDLRKDPMFNEAQAIRDADFMSQFREEFADCSKTNVFENRVTQSHIANYQTCERLVKPTGNCDIRHEVIIKAKPADMVFVIDNSASMEDVIASLRNSISNLALILGEHNDGDLRIGGAVSRGDQYVSNHIKLTQDVPAFQRWVESIAISPGVTYTANATQWVLNNYTWRPDADKVIVIIGNADDPGAGLETVKGNMVSGGFTGYIFHDDANHQTMGTPIAPNFSAASLFKMAQFLTLVEDVWTPQSCLNDAMATLEEFCTGSYEVVEGGTEVSCVNLSGFEVCPGDPIYQQLREPPIPNVPKLATKVRVSALECDYNEGQMECWTDPQGVTHCPTNEGGNEVSCAAFESNPSCGFVSQSCVEGASGSLGNCYVFNEVWDCGYSVDVPTLVNTGAKIECPGGARCMGSECFDTSNTLSNDFAYAVAMLQVAQFAEHDLDCGETGLDCTVFKGEAMECKKALGGYVDCCEAPEGISVTDYVRLTMGSLKMASSVEALSRTGSFFNPGYWQAAQGAVSAGAKELVTGNWGGVMDAATGQFNQLGTELATDGIIAQFKEQMMKMTYDAMKDLGADAAADAMFQQGATEGGMQLSSQAMAAVNFIGAVYTAYVIADLMVKIIWKCEEDEFELGAKKETRQCTYVGSYCASEVLGSCVEKRESYCCFGSVVARVVQEQGRPQLGMNFGDVKAPTCEGLTPADMQRIDWNKIDLGEWIGMLSLADHLPTVDTVGLEKLTGSGSALADIFSEGAEPRANSLDRNLYRLEGVDVDEIKRQAEIESLTEIK